MRSITTARRLAVFAVVTTGVGVWAACSPFDGSDAASVPPEEAGAVVDGAPDQAVHEDASGPMPAMGGDSAIDVDADMDPDGCLPFTAAVFNGSQPWKIEGIAKIAGGNEADLGELSAESNSAIYFELPAPTKAFKIRFTMAIAPMSATSGFALAWVTPPGLDIPNLGGTADALGFCPTDNFPTAATGNALGFDIVGHTLWTKALNVTTSTCDGIASNVVNVLGASAAIEAYVTPTKVSGTISGAAFSLMNEVATISWIGITAGTGPTGGTFTVSNLSIATCK